jgi:protein AbiQ
MRFYNIKDDYINFLRTFDKKVAENKQESRPYVGIVLAEALIEIDINNLNDEKYKNLLLNQLSYVNADKTQIEKTACNLHTLIFTDTSDLSKYDTQIKARCCDLTILEKEYTNFNSK